MTACLDLTLDTGLQNELGCGLYGVHRSEQGDLQAGGESWLFSLGLQWFLLVCLTTDVDLVAQGRNVVWREHVRARCVALVSRREEHAADSLKARGWWLR